MLPSNDRYLVEIKKNDNILMLRHSPKYMNKDWRDSSVSTAWSMSLGILTPRTYDNDRWVDMPALSYSHWTGDGHKESLKQTDWTG